MQPITVQIHEIRKPNSLPKARVFIVIKTNKGKTGKIDSATIKRLPKIGP